MKLTKFLALVLALISIACVCTGCGFAKEQETTPAVTLPPDDPSKTAKAHIVFMDIDGNVIYSSEEEDDEMYVFTSPWLEPTILNFVEDYCFMNDNEITCTIDSKTNTLKKITRVDKKGNIDYEAGKKYTDPVTKKRGDTYFLCYVDGKELETKIEDTNVVDGSTITIRLVYVGQDIKLK